jgi:phage terminase large subunit GpA-like protein
MTDESLARSWLRALVQPQKVAPSSFAEREIILPGSANAIPGPLRLAPYQRELVDSIADDETEIVVFMLSSQTGKSISIDAMLGYCIACDPGPMLHVSPTGARSEDFVRDRFDPLIAASPVLRGLWERGKTRGKAARAERTP